MDKASSPTKIVLRNNGTEGLKTPKSTGFLRAFNLEWSIKTLKALLPSVATLRLNVPPVGDSDDIGLSVAPRSPLTLPDKPTEGPVGEDYLPSALNLPVSPASEPAAGGSFQVALTIPETIVEDGPVRPTANKPVPASFQQARRQRYIYDW